MARALTGTVAWDATKKTWRGRLSLVDGSRPWFDVPGLPHNERGEMRAREIVLERAAIARKEKLTSQDFVIAQRKPKVPDAPKGESWTVWHGRYLEVHERLGKSTRDMKGAAKKWIADRVGDTPVSSFKRDDVVGIRDALTAAVQAGEMSAKRAMNIWGDIITAPLSRAFSDDDPQYASVRVGPAVSNPATNVKPPVTKEQLDATSRDRQPMFPREFLRLIACTEIPVIARQIYALATYLYLRPQELYALRWTDVDWEAGEVRIRRKLDVRTGEEKAGTKTDAGIREVPIHPNLMPLLKAMYEEREADNAKVIPLVGAARLFERFADRTRQHIRLVKLERTELVEGSADLMPFDFRSWRTTGCTWLAMLGTDSYVIALQAGHKSPDVTWSSYIKRGPDLRQRYGEPFPALPEDLLGSDDSSGESSGRSRSGALRGRFSGEGGIRTRGPLLTDARLASGYLRPLGHLS